LILLFIPIMIAIGWVAWHFSAREINCETTTHTFCPADIDERLQSLKKVSWWRLNQPWKKISTELHQTYPEITTLRLQRQWNGTLQIWLEQAPVLVRVKLADQPPLNLHTNGILTASADTDGPLILLPHPESWFYASDEQWRWRTEVWTEPVVKNFPALVKEALLTEQQRIQSIEAISPQEIIVHLNSGQRAIVRIDRPEDWTRQRSTLQAFFRSTTINPAWQEVDVRFHDIIVR
jgi:hypothetical protein